MRWQQCTNIKWLIMCLNSCWCLILAIERLYITSKKINHRFIEWSFYLLKQSLKTICWLLCVSLNETTAYFITYAIVYMLLSQPTYLISWNGRSIPSIPFTTACGLFRMLHCMPPLVLVLFPTQTPHRYHRCFIPIARFINHNHIDCYGRTYSEMVYKIGLNLSTFNDSPIGTGRLVTVEELMSFSAWLVVC